MDPCLELVYWGRRRQRWTALQRAVAAARVPSFASRFRKVLETAAMDDTYRSALGVEAPSPQKIARAKRILRFFVRMRALLPKDPYIESLQNFVSYPNGVDIEHAGERARSERLPAACPFASRAMREKIEPEIPPILHPEEAPAVELRTIAWDEVRRHRTEDDLWVVFGGHVYDVSAFARNHPGGLQILLKSNGRDMTKAFEKAGHSDLTKVFALNFRIGKIEVAPSPAVRPPTALADAHVQLN